jgi:hypothetical protein
MRRLILASLAASLLSACVSETVYHAAGVTLATRDADIAGCERHALSRFPVQTQIRYTPRVYVPPRQVCNSAGSCTIRPGYFDGGDPYTVDLNENFRRTAFAGCMGARGYTEVGLPRCEEGEAIVLSTTMPPLTGGTCLYRPAPGPALIVNPA